MHRAFLVAVGLLILVGCILLVMREPGRPAAAFTIDGVVTRVVDGDTLWLVGDEGEAHKIRLSDIDSPEHTQAACPRSRCPDGPLPERPGQPHAKEATASLAELAPRGAVAHADCYEIGPYGRPVCHVFVGESHLNLEQIRRGWAMVALRDDWLRDPESAPAEAAARKGRLGVWQAPDPVHPADWRRECWRDGACPRGQVDR